MRRQTCTVNYGRSLPLAQGVSFDLPEELIATRPASPRSSARLLVALRNGEDVDGSVELPATIALRESLGPPPGA